MFMEVGLTHMSENLEKKGIEIEISRLKKVGAMKRAVQIIKNYNEGNYIEMAESEIGSLHLHDWEFEEVPDKPKLSRLVEKNTEEEDKHNSKVFELSRKIEEKEWKELFKILKGQDYKDYKKFEKTLTEEEKKYFFDTFGPICDEIFVEKVVPQWAETQLTKQNDVTETGMYGQSISAWKEVCPFIFMYMQFNCDGTVSPCTLDWPRKVVVGNVNDESVSDIWNGDSLRELQVAMLAGKRKCINFCGACSAPMVCVEEDLDPHCQSVIETIGGQKDFGEIDKNKWIDHGQVIQIHSNAK
jgi:radical SAM protein with 4Fe4S-binding SPASM domain